MKAKGVAISEFNENQRKRQRAAQLAAERERLGKELALLEERYKALRSECDLAARSAQAPQEQLTMNGNPNIPKALADLMAANNVDEGELQRVVSMKGYYPEDTPIENYDPAFIDGVLVGAWKQVFSMIMRERDLPF